MKTIFNEINGAFLIRLTPETMEEQTQLIRMGLNWKKEKPYVFVYAQKERGVEAGISIRKTVEDVCEIKRK